MVVRAASVLGLLACVVVPRLDWDRRNKFFAAAMLLSLIPCCATFPSDRMLLFCGLGADALIAQFLMNVFTSAKRRPETRAARLTAGLLVAVHCVWAPIFLSLRAAFPAGPPALVEQMSVRTRFEDSIAEQTVVIVNAPSALHAAYMPLQREFEGKPVPKRVRVLGPALPAITLTRPDERSLVIRPSDGYLNWFLDRLFRDPARPLALGERVELTGMVVEVTALTPDGRPAEAEFRFDVPLEDPSLFWLHWDDGEFRPCVPPSVGATLELRPRAPGW